MLLANWRESILKHFQRGTARLTLVSDPDGLVTEEGTLTAIKDRGFDVILFEDSIAFRYTYESNYRARWDEGRQTDPVVLLRAEAELEDLPYDLLLDMVAMAWNAQAARARRLMSGAGRG